MSYPAHPVPDLTIANGQQNSDTVALAVYRTARALSIAAPATLTGTISVQGRVDSTNWKTLYSGGADVTISADRVVLIDMPARFEAVRVRSGSAEGAARAFTVHVVYQLD